MANATSAIVTCAGKEHIVQDCDVRNFGAAPAGGLTQRRGRDVEIVTDKRCEARCVKY